MIGLGPGGLQDELLNVCNRIWHNKEQALKAAEVGHYPPTFFLLLRVELVFRRYYPKIRTRTFSGLVMDP